MAEESLGNTKAGKEKLSRDDEKPMYHSVSAPDIPGMETGKPRPPTRMDWYQSPL